MTRRTVVGPHSTGAPSATMRTAAGKRAFTAERFRRSGYVHLADFAGYRFSYDAPEGG